MWTLYFTVLSSISFFLVAWVIDPSTTNTFLGDKETTRNLLTIPLAMLGVTFIFQAGLTAQTAFSIRKYKRSVNDKMDSMTPLSNAKQHHDEGDVVKAEFEFNLRQASPTIALALIIIVIFVTSMAIR